MAEPSNREAVGNNPRGAIGMKPCGSEAGLGRKAVEVNGARLEARKHLFDNALEVVEVDGSRGVERALLR